MLICQVLSGTPDVISRGQYALDVKTKVLPVYEQIFDIEYPLPKLDTLVVRHMFVSELS
jgi:aminopeptidase N